MIANAGPPYWLRVPPVGHLGVCPGGAGVRDPVGGDHCRSLPLGLGPVHQGGHVISGVQLGGAVLVSPGRAQPDRGSVTLDPYNQWNRMNEIILF